MCITSTLGYLQISYKHSMVVTNACFYAKIQGKELQIYIMLGLFTKLITYNNTV